MKRNSFEEFVGFFTMVALVAIVFGVCVPSSYGQENSATDDTAQAMPGPLTVTQCGSACNAAKGYEIGGKLVLTEPGASSSFNITLGLEALIANTTGVYNTAIGYQSLLDNTTGYANVATGLSALQHNTTGYNNIGIGYAALINNTTGGGNTAVGFGPLLNNTTGSYNIGIGYNTCYNVGTGGNDICIGNIDTCINLVSGSNVTCIGSGVGPASDIPGPATYIAGIYGAPTTGSGNPLICVDSTGLLGTTNCATNGAPAAQLELVERQQVQIETLLRQNEELQQRMSRLESLVAKN